VEYVYRIIENKAEALEFNIRENSPVAGHTLLDLKLKKNVLVAGITRNGIPIIPRGHDEMKVGDTVIIVTTHMGFTDIQDILE
jgi:trk system potassium uptake protein TrkA